MAGLFPHYPGDPDATELAGNRAKDQAAALEALEQSLARQGDAASREASGEIEGAVADATRPAGKDAATLRTGALVVSYAVNTFAREVNNYNANIDGWNEQYRSARARDFDVAADAGKQEGNTPKENETAREAAIDEADLSLRRSLERARIKAEDRLDKQADHVAGMLIAGPTPGTVVEMYIHSYITEADATELLGGDPSTAKALRNIRAIAGLVNTSVSADATIPALWAYLARKDPADLPTRLPPGELAKLREQCKLAAKSPQHAADLYRRKSIRLKIGYHMAVGAKPEYLFGRIGRWVGEKAPFLKVPMKVGGKIFPLTGVLSSGVGLGEVLAQVDELETHEFWIRVVGNSAGAIAGGAAFMLGVGLVPLAASGPVGAIAVGAGAIALGVMLYEHREELFAAGRLAGNVFDDWWQANTEVVDDIGELFGADLIPGR